eukprot:5058683-Amphidinium_carterae.1
MSGPMSFTGSSLGTVLPRSDNGVQPEVGLPALSGGEDVADLEAELDVLQADFQKEHDDLEAARLGSLVPDRETYLEH